MVKVVFYQHVPTVKGEEQMVFANLVQTTPTQEMTPQGRNVLQTATLSRKSCWMAHVSIVHNIPLHLAMAGHALNQIVVLDSTSLLQEPATIAKITLNQAATANTAPPTLASTDRD